jgi:hypothetical protein
MFPLHLSNYISQLMKLFQLNMKENLSAKYPSVRLSVHQFVCISVHLSVRPSVYPSISPFVCTSVHLSIRLSIYPSTCLYICLIVSLSFHPSVRLSAIHLSFCQPIRMSVYLFIRPFICLSVHSSVHLHVSAYVCLSVHLSRLPVSVYLSIRLSVCLPA